MEFSGTRPTLKALLGFRDSSNGEKHGVGTKPNQSYAPDFHVKVSHDFNVSKYCNYSLFDLVHI